ncbi:MAG: NADH-quinone oxidoreductase subunit L [Planctomycetaceae bacterium]|nr:NADH-quinone oxidoreductase subunit L [Planctomycetaceae bacterium]
MFDLDTLIVLIPALPLAATLVTAALGKWLLKEYSHVPVLAATGLAFVLSLLLLGQVQSAAGPGAHELREATASVAPAPQTIGYEHVVNLWTWAGISDAYAGDQVHLPPGVTVPHPLDLKIDIALRADPLTSIMLATVMFIATLVVIYASGYMHGDPGYWRFFTYVALFVFSMAMLVSSSNFLLLYVFWEAVGVCSYFLIGFWYQKPEAAAAGMKAFLVNRVGDFCFALGVFSLWIFYGTLNFHDTVAADGTLLMPGVLGQTRLAVGLSEGFVGGGIGLAIALLLFAGACGKSAQFPLHVWLPDAMEGPTPVSALIHAATMVTAGVYMVVRCTPLYFAAPEAQYVVAAIGCFTALFAGLIALTQTDLKRVLAYSTVSQLGYMFLGLGVGTLTGITAGMFHLFTHAFFKGLLFLGAGSVMHAMGGVLDMRRIGGLRRLMPITHVTFWCGALALAGVVPFAGFWSKDAIFAALSDRMHGEPAGGPTEWFYPALYYAGLFTALLTAFYTFRALLLTFYGEERIPPEAGHHAHESPRVMWMPLAVLSLFAIGVGAWFEYTHGFADFLALTPSLAYAPVAATGGHHAFHMDVAAISTLIALSGVGAAAYFYLGDRRAIDALTRALKPAYWLSSGKFFIDQIYGVIILWPIRALSALSAWFDQRAVDGLVNQVGRAPLGLGSILRSLQNGMVQFYALVMVLGLLVLLVGTLWR